MDDDAVLRSLTADLERDDPELAALLSGHSARRHRPVWLLLTASLLLAALLVAALLLPGRVTLGLLATLLVLASPFLVCWLCADTGGHAI